MGMRVERRSTARSKRMGFEKDGLALGKITLQIFPDSFLQGDFLLYCDFETYGLAPPNGTLQKPDGPRTFEACGRGHAPRTLARSRRRTGTRTPSTARTQEIAVQAHTQTHADT